jgi:hypothetical protein
LHVTSQHTPSVQWPDEHWPSPPHDAPLARSGTHTPAEHHRPDAQSELEAQLPRQAVAPHTFGLQSCVCTAGQRPAPSQVAASVAVPPAQVASRQAV